MIKIGFIHFDTIYLIHHFIGSVVELYHDPECEVTILTPDTNQDYLYSLLDMYGVSREIVKKLPTYLYKRIAYKIQGRDNPSTVPLFKKYRKHLLKYDVLAFTVLNHLRIKRKGRNPKFALLMHGAGNSHYPFTEEYYKPISQFDLVTTSGQKIQNLFLKMGAFKDTKFEICGYQKFDVVKVENKKNQFFNNKNPVVVYNPHFRESISSYHRHGQEILKYFYNNKDYNLIFAPHFNLFEEKRQDAQQRNSLDQKYFKTDNILIDFGSVNSVNMAYMLAADIYLGDVSSQVYEFLISGAKPCIFINTHKVKWKNDAYYQTWKLGKVLENPSKLEAILQTKEHWQKDYQKLQEEVINYTFDITEIPSVKRVAQALKSLGTG
jgi:hypothetical protein